jgi:hypothetical protein
MPNLDKKWFKAKGNIDKELAKKLLTVSFGAPVTDTLSRFDWDGKLVATVGLEFTPDNRRVLRGQFLLHGLLTKEPVTLQASKLFPEADPAITMTVFIPDGREFRFNGGSLSSDLMACENFKHHFSKEDRIIFPTDWAANKIGETCMRAVSHLDKTSNGSSGPRPKTTILLFPRSADEMNRLSDGTQNPAWPGLRILQATSEFFPKHDTWKDPFCPLLMLGSPHNAEQNFPAGDDIRFHVSAVMNSAKLPTPCTSGSGLTRQWNKALADVENLEKEPSVIWPKLPRPALVQGKDIVYVLIREDARIF